MHSGRIGPFGIFDDLTFCCVSQHFEISEIVLFALVCQQHQSRVIMDFLLS